MIQRWEDDLDDLQAVNSHLIQCLSSADWLLICRLWRILLWSQHPARTGNTLNIHLNSSFYLWHLFRRCNRWFGYYCYFSLKDLCIFLRQRSTTWQWTWPHSGYGVMCVSGRCFWTIGWPWYLYLLFHFIAKLQSMYGLISIVAVWNNLNLTCLFYSYGFLMSFFPGSSCSASRSPTKRCADCCGRRGRFRVRGGWAEAQRCV